MHCAHDHCVVMNDDTVNGPCHSRHRHLSNRLCGAHNIPAIVAVLSLNNQHEHNANQYANWLTIRRREWNFSMTQSKRSSSHAIVLSVKWKIFIIFQKYQIKLLNSFFFKFICSAIPLRNILTSWTNDSPINRTDFILPKTETPKHRSLTQCLAVFRATPSKFHFWQPKSLEMAVL